MEIKINFHAELEANILEQIEFIQEEFDYLFGHKMYYDSQDRDIAAGLINYLARIVDSQVAIEKLSRSLENLENKYPNLF